MSSPDVRTALRNALQAFVGEEHDLGEMLEMARGLAELIRPYAAPDFECVMAPLPPTPPVSFPGVDGIVRAWREFGEGFASITAELESITESDSAVVMLVSQTIVTAHGGVEMSQPGTLVIAVDGDRVENVQFHLDREAALRAGGL
jgi:hypothetical protein